MKISSVDANRAPIIELKGIAPLVPLLRQGDVRSQELAARCVKITLLMLLLLITIHRILWNLSFTEDLEIHIPNIRDVR